MKNKFAERFGMLILAISSLVYSQTDTLKVLGTIGKIGTADHIIPIYLNNTVHLRGIQLTLNYPLELSLADGDIYATSRTDEFNIEKNIETPGIIRVIIVDFGGETIPPDTGAILNISFSISSDALPGFYPLDLNDIYASDAFYQSVEVQSVDGIFTITNGVIPVELAAFNAWFMPREGNIQLTWQTCSETNNYGFAILRGETENDWEEIGFVEGNGTSSTPNNYEFVDSDINSVMYYYQLKQIDFDGSTELSEIISVSISLPEKYCLLQNYPNPFSLRSSLTPTLIRFQLPVAEFVAIKIYDILGREVKRLLSQNLNSGHHNIQWDGRTNHGSLVSAGVYYCKMETKHFSAIRNLIVLE